MLDIFLTVSTPIRRILNRKACKTSIKFGDKLNKKQINNLIKQIKKCKLPFICAHGRPTIFPLLNINNALTKFNN